MSKYFTYLLIGLLIVMAILTFYKYDVGEKVYLNKGWADPIINEGMPMGDTSLYEKYGIFLQEYTSGPSCEGGNCTQNMPLVQYNGSAKNLNIAWVNIFVLFTLCLFSLTIYRLTSKKQTKQNTKGQ